MPDLSVIETALRRLNPEQLRTTLAGFLPNDSSAAKKTEVIEAALRSPTGQALREAMARWIVDEIVPVERLVPQAYLKWRPAVRDAMMFVVAHLSPARLAPKLVEQLELPAENVTRRSPAAAHCKGTRATEARASDRAESTS